MSIPMRLSPRPTPPGKLADLVILDKYPLKSAPMAHKNLEILETMKEGKTTYTQARARRCLGNIVILATVLSFAGTAGRTYKRPGHQRSLAFAVAIFFFFFYAVVRMVMLPVL